MPPGLPAAEHDDGRPAAPRNGDRAFLDDRRGDEPAADLLQLPAVGRARLSARDLAAARDAVPSIRAVKDWSGDAMAHERNIRALQIAAAAGQRADDASAWLMSSLVLGCNGLLSGAGSVIADLQVALFRAVRANDLAAARAINDRIYPLAQAFYAPPFLDMHNRMKEVLALLGKLPPAVVRPPLLKLGAGDRAARQAIAAAGLERDRPRCSPPSDTPPARSGA